MTEEQRAEARIYEEGAKIADASEYPIELLGLLYTEKSYGEDKKTKMYAKSMENVARIIENHPEYKGRFRYDEWKAEYEVFAEGRWRILEDKHFREIHGRISALYPQFRTIGKEHIVEGVLAGCERQKIDTASAWIAGLIWDKAPRLDTWLDIVYGTGDSPYHRAAGANWFKGLAKRIVEPGCKFDYVLMLKGRQGCGKTTSLAVIGGDWHMETTSNADTKDFFLQFRGHAVIELAEGSTMSNTDVKKMKAVISAREDKYREPYGRMVKTIPRRCVFAMTTNDDQPLRDDTGNRRFLPVEVMREYADIEWLEANRDQLFAEAYHRAVVMRETLHEFPEETATVQEASVEDSPYIDAVAKWLEGRLIGDEGLVLSDVWCSAIYGDLSRFGMLEQKKLGIAMKKLGYVKVRKMVDRLQKNRWVLSDQTVKHRCKSEC